MLKFTSNRKILYYITLSVDYPECVPKCQVQTNWVYFAAVKTHKRHYITY